MRPEDLLPHRPPFLFIDEIVNIAPGESASGRWKLSGEEWFFEGHFPGRPTLPGVLMCEAIAQVGALAVLADERFAGRLPLFGGIDKARLGDKSFRATNCYSNARWDGYQVVPVEARELLQ